MSDASPSGGWRWHRGGGTEEERGLRPGCEGRGRGRSQPQETWDEPGCSFVCSCGKREPWGQAPHFACKLDRGLEVGVPAVSWHWEGKLELRGVVSRGRGRHGEAGGTEMPGSGLLRAGPWRCPWGWLCSPPGS